MAEEITLKVNVETGKAVTNLGNLEKATKGVTKATKQADQGAETLEQQFDSLNKEIKEGPVNIRRMNKQIQEYQAIALEAGRTSPLGKKAIQEAAQLKDRYNDITAEVNRLANDGVKMQAALDIGTTVIAGYAAFQGALAIAGVDSEKYRETLIKLQGAQSLLMGIETLRKNLEKESTVVLMAKNAQEKASIVITKLKTFVTNGATVATKALRVALLALPFVVIGAAIALYKAFAGEVEKVKTAQQEYNEVVKEAEKSVQGEIVQMKVLIKTAKDETLSKAARNDAIEKLQKQYPDYLGNLSLEEINTKKVDQAVKDLTKSLQLKARSKAMEAKLSEKAAEQIKIEDKIMDDLGVSREDAIKLLKLEGEEMYAVGQLAQSIGKDYNQVAANQEAAQKVLDKYNISLKANGKELKNGQIYLQVWDDDYQEATAAIEKYTGGLIDANSAQSDLTAAQKDNIGVNKEADNADKKAAKEADNADKKAEADAQKRSDARKERAAREKQAIYDLALAQKQANAEEIEDAEAKANALIKIESFKLEHQLQDKKLTDGQRELLEFKTQQAIDKIREDFAQKEIDRQIALKVQETEILNELYQSVEDLENAHLDRMTEDQKRNQEIEINAIYDKYNAQIEALKARGESTKLLEEAQGADIAEIKKKYTAQEIADAQAVKDAKTQMALDGLSAVMDLTSAFAKDNEKSQKRAFEINKKLQIAMALIQTYQGVQAIFATRAASPETILFPAAPFIAAGIALATGLANVQNIRKQKFSGGAAGGSFGGGGVPGGGGGAPQIDPVTNTSTLVPQEDQKVYVTETDISDTQNKVSVIEAQSTF
tara:strand:+ start:4633 stop:7119 length:2487 start_codon:yes stop_codon:yes gene_type:complete